MTVRKDTSPDSPVAIVEVAPGSDEAVALMQALDDDLRRRYPGVEIHGLRPEDMSHRRLVFLVARAGGQAIACGAVRELEPGVGEVKRMFVTPAWRGKAVARRLLARLEGKAREAGYQAVRIETGIGQPEAIALYQSAGYTAIPPFGEYIGNPASVCFEKRWA
jgi:putative acetyltransferase